MKLIEVYRPKEPRVLPPRCSCCDSCGPTHAIETRLDGMQERRFYFCEGCAELADTDIPVIRHCEVCGKGRDIRRQDACVCGCSTLRRISADTALPVAIAPVEVIPTDSEGKIRWREWP